MWAFRCDGGPIANIGYAFVELIFLGHEIRRNNFSIDENVGAVRMYCAKVKMPMNHNKPDVRKQRYWQRTIVRRHGVECRSGSFAASGG
jgi:hypothetical protein